MDVSSLQDSLRILEQWLDLQASNRLSYPPGHRLALFNTFPVYNIFKEAPVSFTEGS